MNANSAGHFSIWSSQRLAASSAIPATNHSPKAKTILGGRVTGFESPLLSSYVATSPKAPPGETMIRYDMLVDLCRMYVDVIDYVRREFIRLGLDAWGPFVLGFEIPQMIGFRLQSDIESPEMEGCVEVFYRLAPNETHIQR